MLENGKFLSPDSHMYNTEWNRLVLCISYKFQLLTKTSFAAFGLHNVLSFQLRVLIPIFLLIRLFVSRILACYTDRAQLKAANHMHNKRCPSVFIAYFNVISLCNVLDP
jgi:hypothetical protein